MPRVDDLFKLKEKVLEAVDAITNSGISNIYPYVRTITSFLRGVEASPFYYFYSKHPSICGSYKDITKKDIELALNSLTQDGSLNAKKGSNGNDLYSLPTQRKKTCETSKINFPLANLSFYQSANQEEKKILDEFNHLITSLLHNHILKDTKTTYGFVPQPKGDETVYQRCWISRDNKTQNLYLHYKKEPSNSDKILPLASKKQVDEAWRQLRLAYDSSFNEIEQIIFRIRNKDPFSDYTSRNKCDVELMPHQKAGVELAMKYERFAFFYDTGTGKTIMALEIMMNYYAKSGAKFLVVAPKPLIKSAWMDDAKHFSKMKLMPLSKNMTNEDYAKLYDQWTIMDGGHRKYTDAEGSLLLDTIPKKEGEIIKQHLYSKAQHFIVNIDAIRESDKGEQLLRDTNCTGLIIDESVIIKNYKSKNARRMRVFAKMMKYVYLLSGKPAPNNSIEYYSQMKIIDPQTFNISYDDFLSKYYRKDKFRYVDKNNITRNNVAKMVGNRSVIVKKEECLKLPETFHQRIVVELDDNSRKFYRDILNRFLTEVVTMDGSKIRVRCLPKLASIMKLREVASGFYLDGNDAHMLNPNKITALKDLLERIGYDENGRRNKVLIWCNFKYEIQTIQKELAKCGYKVVTAYSGEKQIDNNIEAFKHGDAEVMIAHPQTLKYGVTFTCCHYAIFSSMSYSYDDYYQAHDRIYRKGQEQICFFYHLLSENTIDEIIYHCVTEKEKKSKFFERLVKSASKHKISKQHIENSLHISSEVLETILSNRELSGSDCK